MSKRTNDGGPAFPITRTSSFSKNYEGMTLRDWFAGQALLMSWVGFDRGYYDDKATDEKIAANAYAIADAMIAARGGEQ